MTQPGEKSDILSGKLFVEVAEATSGLEPPLTPQSVLGAINSAIKKYSAGTGMPELAERIAKNRTPEILGALMLLEPLNSDTLALWRQQVDAEVQTASKLPRKTKKAAQKKAAGKPLGQRELARLQALREQNRHRGD